MARPTDDQRRAVLSIDLGASFTKVAWRPEWLWVQGDGLPADREYEDNVYTAQSSSISIDGSALIPSLAYEPADGGEWSFGQQAADKPMASAGKLHSNWKKQLFEAIDGSVELSGAGSAARGFLIWLRTQIERNEPGLLDKAHTSVCVPKFSRGDEGLRRLAQAFEAAGWNDHSLLRIYEPEANLIGLTANGRNRVRASPTHHPEPRLDYMFPHTAPLFHAARQQVLNGAPPVNTCVIDIGAYTTDIAVCAVGEEITLSHQESYDHGIFRLDDQLRHLIEQSGGRLQEITTSEFELLKRDAYALRNFTLAQAGGLTIAGNQLESAIEEFSAELWRKVSARTRGAKWAVLTGGGALIHALQERVFRSLPDAGIRDMGHFFQDADRRTATAHGGCSVYFLPGAARGLPLSPAPSPPDTDEVECSCRGNRDCIRCGGKGYRRPLPVPIPTPPSVRPESRPLKPLISSPPSGLSVSPPRHAQGEPPPTPPVLPKPRQEPSSPSTPPTPVDYDAVHKAWNTDREHAIREFTLSGWMGDFIFSGDVKDAAVRGSTLRATDGLPGKVAWFRLFCLGVAMGIRTPRARLKALLKAPRLGEVLEAMTPESLAEVGSAAFFERTDVFFEQAIHRQFRDENASGEDAELWRRVFYDFRKMHYFVFRNDLPGAFLELSRQPNLPWDGLASFLRSGRHPDGRWLGAIGQSMTAPILFLLRELRRLGLTDERFDQTCFYMNGPARRVAVRLGWITDSERFDYDFDSLKSLCRSCHDIVIQKAPEWLHEKYFDLPLQWYADQNRNTLNLMADD